MYSKVTSTKAMNDFTSFGYQTTENLGHNSYGGRVTYKAIRLSDRQSVVIKQFQFTKNSNWNHYKEVEQEIKILQTLNHKSIPRYLDHFDTENGICLVQEYKNAQPLSLQQSFTPGRIKDLAISILDILIYLQKQSPPVIHRDLKPENILLDEEFKVYLVDFGFSRSVTAGTFGFMPPEQLHNQQLTQASDLYSLGITLTCLSLGIKSVEVGSLIDLNTNRLNLRGRMPELSRDFIQWLEKMVEPSPEQRFSNAATALKAIEPISLTRCPKIVLNQSLLEFWADRPNQKLTQTLTIENSVPETFLKGELQVAANEKDPLCANSAHPWISISPQKFKGNQVKCKITVDTRRLKVDRVYKRWILVHTNTSQNLNPYKVQIQVYTGVVKNSVQTNSSTDIPKIPYRFLVKSFLVTFLPTVLLCKANTLFGGNLLMQIIVPGYVLLGLFPAIVLLSTIGALVGAIGGMAVASLLGIDDRGSWVNVGGVGGAIGCNLIVGLSSIFSELAKVSSISIWILGAQFLTLLVTFPIGVIGMFTTAQETAGKCYIQRIPKLNTIILSRLIPAFGISLGVGLVAGFSSLVVSMLMATGLPVSAVIAIYSLAASRQHRVMQKNKQFQKDLIEP
jgi:serine/threonine protein kinase